MKQELYFLLGACIGSVITYAVLDKRYRKKIVETEDELRDYYIKKQESNDIPVEEMVIKEKPDLSATYNKIIGKNYAGISKPSSEQPVKQPVSEAPYPIAKSKAGKGDGKESYTLENTWYNYTNGVLVDAKGHRLSMDEIERFVGSNYEDYFGSVDPDDSVVYIRNEALKLDFEIVNADKEYGYEEPADVEEYD
jgi:hypothetical protein